MNALIRGLGYYAGISTGFVRREKNTKESASFLGCACQKASCTGNDHIWKTLRYKIYKELTFDKHGP
jgi:hypothetical protein